jgi:hypothetical protein
VQGFALHIHFLKPTVQPPGSKPGGYPIQGLSSPDLVLRGHPAQLVTGK